MIDKANKDYYYLVKNNRVFCKGYTFAGGYLALHFFFVNILQLICFWCKYVNGILYKVGRIYLEIVIL